MKAIDPLMVTLLLKTDEKLKKTLQTSEILKATCFFRVSYRLRLLKAKTYGYLDISIMINKSH